jgi:hypothetical protein
VDSLVNEQRRGQRLGDGARVAHELAAAARQAREPRGDGLAVIDMAAGENTRTVTRRRR